MSALSDRDVIHAAGGPRQAVAVLRAIANGYLSMPELARGLRSLADGIERDHPPRDPEVGDTVLISGAITALLPRLGEAIVHVYRPGEGCSGTIAVQCGALEHDERGQFADGGVPADVPQ